jgi:hypothetical protein
LNDTGNDLQETVTQPDSEGDGGSTKKDHPIIGHHPHNTGMGPADTEYPRDLEGEEPDSDPADDRRINEAVDAGGAELDDWLASYMTTQMVFPKEEAEEARVETFLQEDEEAQAAAKQKTRDFDPSGTRASADDAKNKAFYGPILPSLDAVYQRCNRDCCLSGYCTENIPGSSITSLRRMFYGEEGEEAPKDKARAQLILGLLRKARETDCGQLVFNVDGYEVCTPAFLRLLGVMTSCDMTKAPGQWQRLMNAHLRGNEDDDHLVSTEELNFDCLGDNQKRRNNAKIFIRDIIEYFADTLPAVTSDDGNTGCRQVPYRTCKDFYAEYEFHCFAFNVQDVKASYATFLRGFNEIYDEGLVKLLGGKGGFNTCSICNNVLSIKKGLSGKRNLIMKEALLKLHRLHLLQQATERQHADNVANDAKKLENGMPTLAYFDIDGQSTWAGNTPKWMKDRKTSDGHVIENRNIGARIICGPIDDYISICTDNLMPSGANILIEVTKYCMEYAAKMLAMHNMVMPQKVALQFDNSGENKNKEMFCFLSNLVEDCYFKEIEMFFLVVGHTHNILDQWFSVLSKAIRGAHFIGSVLALHELYKFAHNDEAAHLRPKVVHQLQLYHDWRRYYNPVRNNKIKHFRIPLRFKFKLDPLLNVCLMQYMKFSPPEGFKHLEKWQPVVDKRTSSTTRGSGLGDEQCEGNVAIASLDIFNGKDTVLKCLDYETPNITNAADVYDAPEDERKKFEEAAIVMPIIREIEVRAIGEAEVRMDREAEDGVSLEADQIVIPVSQLKAIDQDISNSAKDKRDGSSHGAASGSGIAWLKRSQITQDPLMLDRRPDILPNHKLWRQRIANAPTGDSKKWSPEQKQAKKDASEAQQRLVSFQSGASTMALTAKEVLKVLKDGGSSGIDGLIVQVSADRDILRATNKFKKHIITQREVQWYESINHADKITRLAEIRVAAAEAITRPWRLLDFPEVTPEQKAHIEALNKLREERVAKTEAALRKLVLRAGEGEYDPDAQVITYEGFTSARATDIDKMTRADLAALAKGHIPKYGSMKKEDLLKALKQFMADHPNIIQLPTSAAPENAAVVAAADGLGSGSDSDSESEVQAFTVPRASTGTQAVTDHDIQGVVHECAVKECDASDVTNVIFCNNSECMLHFCIELHGPHDSHKWMPHVRPPMRLSEEPSTVTQAPTIMDNPQAPTIPIVMGNNAPSEQPKATQKTKSKSKSTSTSSSKQTEPSISVNDPSVARKRNVDDGPGNSSPNTLKKIAKTITARADRQAVAEPAMLQHEQPQPQTLAVTFQALQSGSSSSQPPALSEPLVPSLISPPPEPLLPPGPLPPLNSQPSSSSMPVIDATVAIAPAISTVISGASRRLLEGDDERGRRQIEDAKLQGAIAYLRTLVDSREVSLESKCSECYKKFNYPSSYDLAFLSALADHFGVDVQLALIARRPTPKDVLALFISKLFK